MSNKAAATRLNILQKAFELVYRNGYRATSVDDIIATTAVTKGAFFYHFKSKDEMGLAMISEIMAPGMLRAMTEPLIKAGDPIEELYKMMRGLLVDNEFFVVRYGCPAINLIEEMASQDNAFATALTKLTSQWRDAIITCIENGKSGGKVSKDTDAKAVALYIMSGYGGIRNLGKIYGAECYTGFLAAYRNYLNTLA